MAQPPIEPVVRDALGGIIIRSQVASPRGRLGFEKQFFPGVELGLTGWERAHSQGNITGRESAQAIRYAPSEVNQAFQRLGIERFIRELYEEKASDVELMLTTVTYSHTDTLRLREIQYRIDAVRKGRTTQLFEASIEVENQTVNPRVTIEATPYLPRELWERLLR